LVIAGAALGATRGVERGARGAAATACGAPAALLGGTAGAAGPWMLAGRRTMIVAGGAVLGATGVVAAVAW
jgi:hypothetical protein